MTAPTLAADTDPVALVGMTLDALALGSTAAEAVDTVRSRLREPLRVVVAGRLKAGKSTLVNALLGQRVAPTDVGECTRLVTWFRYDSLERAEVRLTDGTTKAVQFEPDGTLPADLGLRASTVERLDVWLSNETLRAMTLIDTPGLASTDTESSQATRKLLSVNSRRAADEADALLFVLNGSVRSDERAVLKDFATAQGVRGCAVNSMAVLTKADQIGDDGTLDQATQLAKRTGERLADEVSTVIPIVGLWAECATTGGLTENDAALLHQLAEMDDVELDDTLISSERFMAADVESPDRRARLLQLVGLPGIEKLVSDGRNGSVGAVAIRDELLNSSGISGLKAQLDATFQSRSAPLRAWRALEELQRLAFGRNLDPEDRTQLQDAVELLRFHDLLHHVAELQALSDVCAREVDLPDDLVAELRRCALDNGTLLEGPGHGSARQQADAGMRRWHAFALTAAPKQARIARTMMRSYRRLAGG